MKLRGLLGGLLLAPLAVAGEPSLDELLEGFDEAPLAETEVLDGFEEEDPLEAALDGFEDAEAVAIETEVAVAEESAWQFRGYWSNGLSWNIAHDAPSGGRPDYRGLSRLSSKLWLELEHPLGEGWKWHGDGHLRRDFAYQIHGESTYPNAVVERYQQDESLGEFWVAGSLNEAVDLKLGRQTVVWGLSDLLRINDTLNPLDMREPGLGELETLRRPLAMARGDYYQGPWSVTLLMVPEQRPNLTAPCGGEFSATGAETECQAAVPQQFPDDGWEEMEWGVAAMGRFSGWDLSLYGARLNHDTPYLESGTYRYARLNQLGAALNVADGSWLWRGEIAYFNGLRFANSSQSHHRFDLLLGGEYRGWRDQSLTLEVARRELSHYDPSLLTEPDYTQERRWQTAVSWQHDFNNDTLHLKAILLRNGAQLDEGGYSRLSAEMDLDDQWQLSGGGIWYQSGIVPPDWGDNDRLFVELRRDF